MASGGCVNGTLLTLTLALLLLPLQYYYVSEPLVKKRPLPEVKKELSTIQWLDNAIAQFPPLDILATITLLVLGFTAYLLELIQTTFREHRIIKLNRYLCTSIERLRSWDAQQKELETTIKMVQNATSEYNLLLYLLLRQNRCLGTNTGPPSNYFFEKTLPEDFSYWIF